MRACSAGGRGLSLDLKDGVLLVPLPSHSPMGPEGPSAGSSGSGPALRNDACCPPADRRAGLLRPRGQLHHWWGMETKGDDSLCLLVAAKPPNHLILVISG